MTHDQTDGIIDVGTGTVKFLDEIHMNAGLYIATTLSLGSEIKMGGDNYARIGRLVDNWGTVISPNNTDGFGNYNVGIVAYNNRGNDYLHNTPSTNPTLWGHSATAAATATDEWWSLTHDVTNTVMTSGDGAIQLVPDSTFGIDVQTTGAKVACSATTRGQLFLEEGAADATDTLYMCMKAAANTYSWISITTGG